MIRSLSTACGLTMLLAGAALAQTSTPQGGTTPPAGGSVTGGGVGVDTDCRGEIIKAEPMLNRATGEKHTTAARELAMAKDSLAKNDERSCMTHVENAKRVM